MIHNENIFCMFEKMALENPLNIALVSKSHRLSYKELYEKSNNFARYLNENGIKNEEIVCIIGEKSFELIACILGTLRAGGAYFIIDPVTPRNRINVLLSDTNSRFIFANKVDAETFSELNPISLECIYEHENSTRVPCNRKNENLAYIIYTSGTTGQPKGVMIEDRNVITYIRSFKEIFQVRSSDRMIQLSPCFFDGFAEEVFSMLLSGGCLVMIENNVAQSPRLIKKAVDEFSVTFLATTPLILNELNKLDPMDTLRVLISGGDVLKLPYYTNLVKYTSVYNMYGPSESTVVATYHKCSTDDNFNTPIGKPLPNYDIGIYDKNLGDVPNGEIGEIFITGGAIARGYLNNENFSKERFMIINGQRMYRTGDLGIMHSDKSIEFKGRNDRQVKVNCHRIEMAEIEAVISCYTDIYNAIAVVKDVKDDEKRICVFYTADKVIEDEYLRKHISDNLPSYMIPDLFIKIDNIPMSSTGKVDYKALQNSINLDGNISVQTSGDEIELDFLNIIASCIDGKMNNRNISLNDKLTEVGINSITFVAIVVNLEKKFDIEFDDESLINTDFVTFLDLYKYVLLKLEHK